MSPSKVDVLGDIILPAWTRSPSPFINCPDSYNANIHSSSSFFLQWYRVQKLKAGVGAPLVLCCPTCKKPTDFGSGQSTAVVVSAPASEYQSPWKGPEGHAVTLTLVCNALGAGVYSVGYVLPQRRSCWLSHFGQRNHRFILGRSSKRPSVPSFCQ